MILKLLRGKGVLSEGEYRAAMAETPNVGRLQRKIEDSISQPPVFALSSSASSGAPPPQSLHEGPAQTGEQPAPAEGGEQEAKPTTEEQNQPTDKQ